MRRDFFLAAVIVVALLFIQAELRDHDDTDLAEQPISTTEDPK
jgi:hypothetical protein